MTGILVATLTVMPNKKFLHEARNAKKDEFYTQLSDIERELKNYKEHFKWKTVLCNCDDPRVSNFFHYFAYNFEQLGLKRLITTCYKNQNPNLFTLNESEKAVYLIYDWDKNWNHVPDVEEIWVHNFKWDGDFRSEECVELLKQADIVVTNPPFSLFREYVAQLMEYDKKFLIIWNINCISYKEIFPLIRDNKIWLWTWMGRRISWFIVPNSYWLYWTEAGINDNWQRIVSTNNCLWLTNLDHHKRHEELILYCRYNPDEYPKYDNYDAINIDKTSNIPCDYDWIMWVPITFLDKYNPDQFEILDINPHFFSMVEQWLQKPKQLTLKNVWQKDPYARILIRRKK